MVGERPEQAAGSVFPRRRMTFRALARALPWALGALICAPVGCASGDLRLLPEASGGAPTTEPPEGSGGAAGATTLPPPDCVSAECETTECNQDPACRNECRKQLAACASACQVDEECPTKTPFCHPELALCTRCARNEHCVLLYRGARSVCSDGMCLPCQAASDCPSGVACDRGRCGDCVFDEDCNGNYVCRDYRCATP